VPNNGSRVVVVTGAAGALGSSLVSFLAARGSRVVAIDRPEAGARLAEVARESAGVTPIELGTTSLETWSPVIERITADLGPPTGAVLVAGGYRGGKPLVDGDGDSSFRALFETNVESARVALQAVLGPMVQAKRGSIVLIGSRAAERPWESTGAAAYAASKAALVALSKVAAAEVLQDSVRVNAVLPSTLDTAANRAQMPNADRSRWVTLESLCDVIAFLLSDASRDVSGAALPVYGRVGA
jgi:NAD(P)-dependent dehydrogenase (short-subunit alcohol dehydrogenase family)